MNATRRDEVLLVEDEPTVLSLLELGLAQLGFRVTSCCDASQALALVEAAPGRFAVIVTDFDLPGFSGLELADRVRAAAPHVRIVLHSGSCSPLDAEGRVDAIVPKPARIRELSSVIRGLLE
ncbi:MAG: response regulator [Polyangiaceae bacterium]|nr:response regulator [Polyangiaceae bacterium]